MMQSFEYDNDFPLYKCDSEHSTMIEFDARTNSELTRKVGNYHFNAIRPYL